MKTKRPEEEAERFGETGKSRVGESLTMGGCSLNTVKIGLIKGIFP